jgi:hypothetical protein
MEGLVLELSDFAIGSNELRCRVVGPGRLKLEEAERQERAVTAAEKSARAAQVGAGASVVSAVAAVVAVAIAVGSANPAAHRICNQYNVQNFYVRAPKEAPRVITKDEVEQGRQRRLKSKGRAKSMRQTAESEALLVAMKDREVVDLAGWFHHEPHNGYSFETMHGNRFPVDFPYAKEFEDNPVALRTIVSGSRNGLRLEVVDVIARLSDY